jgi:hypothetical protein
MILVQVSGPAATGKTTGARFLDSKKTYYISPDKKGLSWKGWKSEYNKENKNYAETNDPATVYKLVKAVSETRPDINCIVIDTINGMMTAEEMRILESPSRDKWADQ